MAADERGEELRDRVIAEKICGEITDAQRFSRRTRRGPARVAAPRRRQAPVLIDDEARLQIRIVKQRHQVARARRAPALRRREQAIEGGARLVEAAEIDEAIGDLDADQILLVDRRCAFVNAKRFPVMAGRAVEKPKICKRVRVVRRQAHRLVQQRRRAVAVARREEVRGAAHHVMV